MLHTSFRNIGICSACHESKLALVDSRALFRKHGQRNFFNTWEPCTNHSCKLMQRTNSRVSCFAAKGFCCLGTSMRQNTYYSGLLHTKKSISLSKICTIFKYNANRRIYNCYSQVPNLSHKRSLESKYKYESSRDRVIRAARRTRRTIALCSRWRSKLSIQIVM